MTAKKAKPRSRAKKRSKKVTSEDLDILSAIVNLVNENSEPEEKSLPLLDCKQTCVQKALASQIVLEALASTVWEPVEFKHAAVEYLVVDIYLVELSKGRQTFGVTVQAINNPRDEKDDILLHEFLTTFHPVRQLNVKDYQS